MSDEIIKISFNKVLQSDHYTLFFLGTEDKRFAIYTEPKVGLHLQSFLSHEEKLRPDTYDLLRSILEGFSIKPLHILFHDVKENIYFSRLFLEQSGSFDTKQIVEIDTRPSDALTIALMYDLPIFCTKDLLDKAPEVEE
ncbi:MAG: bifunctional nuclease family protein [Chlamydiae bacterium]|nr:bifunctional nuclease family protein [Chlamydiota bacterium]